VAPVDNNGINTASGLPGPTRVTTQGAATTYCHSDNNVVYNPGGLPACPP